MTMHEEIAAYILQQIKDKKLLPGDQIPTENELAKQFNASRPTVRQALERLKAQGNLVRYQGRGTFVANPKILHESTSFIAGYRKECEKKNQQLLTKVLSLKTKRADTQLAQKLAVKHMDKVICLTRLRFLCSPDEKRPVIYTTVYVPYKNFEFLLEVDFEQKSFYETMEERGYKVVHASRCLEVRTVTQEIGSALKMGAFEPAIYVSSVGKTAMEEPVEYSISYYPAGSSQFLIEIHQ